MKTQRITTEIAQAADAIRAGQLVAVPTETVYGLAGNGLDPKAVAQIYEVKGRPSVKPLSLMVHDASAMARYCDPVPQAAHTLAEAFWPGPLTIVLRAKACVPEIVRAGGQTVGLRCPDHPATLALIEAAQLPLAAPSANPSGAPSPKTADDVLAYFDGQIAAVIDGGPCGIGRESTLVDLSCTPYRHPACRRRAGRCCLGRACAQDAHRRHHGRHRLWQDDRAHGAGAAGRARHRLRRGLS